MLGVLDGDGWSCIYSPPHQYSYWTESNNFLSTGAPDSPVPTRHGTVLCLVSATLADRWGL
jgi:hypothetical protein